MAAAALSFSALAEKYHFPPAQPIDREKFEIDFARIRKEMLDPSLNPQPQDYPKIIKAIAALFNEKILLNPCHHFVSKEAAKKIFAKDPKKDEMKESPEDKSCPVCHEKISSTEENHGIKVMMSRGEDNPFSVIRPLFDNRASLVDKERALNNYHDFLFQLIQRFPNFSC